MALDGKTGQVIDQFATGRGISAAPYVDEKSGEAFVMSVDANLFALKLGWVSQLEVWPWDQ